MENAAEAVDEEKRAGIEEKGVGNGEMIGENETVECVGIFVDRTLHLHVAENVGEAIWGNREGEKGKHEGRKGETDSAEKRRSERLEAQAANWTPGRRKSERMMSGLCLDRKKH